jgi:hypothetical protein
MHPKAHVRARRVASDRCGIKILFNIVWRGAPMSNVDHGAHPLASSERSTSPRESLSGGASIPRMIDPFSERFDPARMPLLFSPCFLARCTLKRQAGFNRPKSGDFGIGNLRALC